MPNPDGSLTLEEKVDKLERDLSLGTSRTGAPLFSPKVFAWVALVVAVALTTLGSLLTIYPDSKAIQVALAVAGGVATVLGIASPGLRKAAVVLLMVVSVTTLSSCTFIKRVGRTAEMAAPAVLDCFGDACKDALPGLVAIAAGELGNVIQGGSFDVEPVIDQLLVEKGPFMACAIAEVLKAWEQAGGGAGMEAPTDLESRRLLFVAAHVGQTHLLAKGYILK